MRIITEADVDLCWKSGEAHRICFRYTHGNQPKLSEVAHKSYVGSFSLPFDNGVRLIFEADTGLKLFPSNYGGVWRSIQTESEFNKIKDWTTLQGTRIFLRDCLYMSIALDQNFVDPLSRTYTHIGALEAAAKNQHDEEAIVALTDLYCQTISVLACYRTAKMIAAVPPRPEKTYDLPSTLAARIAERLGLENLTSSFDFICSKATVKSLKREDKWAAWEKTGLSLKRSLEDHPDVILIDDKYQSGISIQFVASRLQEAGAGRIFGLCAVKTLRDTDNI